MCATEPSAKNRKLPIGIQTVREIREDRCHYFNKLAWARRLADEGKHYFLSVYVGSARAVGPPIVLWSPRGYTLRRYTELTIEPIANAQLGIYEDTDIRALHPAARGEGMELNACPRLAACKPNDRQ